jgi:amino acid permease
MASTAKPEYNGDVGVEEVRSDSEENASYAYVAPLHRKLKSRHLQMIAIGGRYAFIAPPIAPLTSIRF